MTRQAKQVKASRNRHSVQYKAEALGLVARVGVAAAAQQLGLNEALLYAWRSKARLEQDQGEAQRQLAVENARLKRELAEKAEELAILKKAAAYFAKDVT